MSDTPPEKPAEPTHPFKKRWHPSDFGTKGSQDSSIEKFIAPKDKMGKVLNESPKMRAAKPYIPNEEKKEEGETAEEIEGKGGDEKGGDVKSKIKKFNSMQ